ncbi:MAG: hypothetical protein WBK28_01680 [Minisyncoccia bacterium]
MRRRRRTWKEYATIGGLSLLLVCLLFMVWGIWKKEEVARRMAEDMKRSLALLEEREKTLRANIADLETSRGQEASLRETYGVARPGEEVIIVVDPAEVVELRELPWWRTLLGFFGL